MNIITNIRQGKSTNIEVATLEAEIKKLKEIRNKNGRKIKKLEMYFHSQIAYILTLKTHLTELQKEIKLLKEEDAPGS